MGPDNGTSTAMALAQGLGLSPCARWRDMEDIMRAAWRYGNRQADDEYKMPSKGAPEEWTRAQLRLTAAALGVSVDVYHGRDQVWCAAAWGGIAAYSGRIVTIYYVYKIYGLSN